jgi:UDP-N-acetylmuramoyl-L-alanyl-D-glutamate--2,6-diaminopimelate ligase
MRLKQLLALEEVQEADGDFDQEIQGLSYDSRKLRAGDVFFAIAGEKTDGHRFIAEALRRGAAAVVLTDKS